MEETRVSNDLQFMCRSPLPSSRRVSLQMQGQRARDTTCEMAIRRRLHQAGFRYRVHYRPLKDVRREPDIVFTAARVAVFVDGCFWHYCPLHGEIPESNKAWWRNKLQKTRARDRHTDQLLSDRGWVAVRVWEHEDPDSAVARIMSVVEERRKARQAERSG